MTQPDVAGPSEAQVTAIDTFVDALYDLLHGRAQSISAIDLSLEVNGWHVDGEVLFAKGPDIGISLDTREGECRYCELLEGDQERWLDVVQGDLHVLDNPGSELLEAAALALLDGLLTARRPLLR